MSGRGSQSIAERLEALGDNEPERGRLAVSAEAMSDEQAARLASDIVELFRLHALGLPDR